MQDTSLASLGFCPHVPDCGSYQACVDKLRPFKKISVLVPTRGRVGRLQTLIDSYGRTVTDEDSEIIFRIDQDDVDTREFFGERNQRFVIGPRWDGYISMPRFFNELAQVATGNVLLCGNDDMVFKTVGWATKILDAANRYPDGIFDIGVSTHNEAHYPFSIVSRKAVEAMGFLWDPRIFWGDVFLRDVMDAFGRCIMLTDVQIDHDWAGNRPDKTFIEGNEIRFHPRGDEYWSGVHKTAVSEAVDALRRRHG